MARKNSLKAHERRTHALMAAPMAAFGVLLVALPLIYVFCTSLVTGGKFEWGMALTLSNYKALLREDYLKVFANSLQLAFWTTVISLLVVAIIVGISKLTSRPGQTDDGEGEP